jgi:hypothetical protein
MGIPHGTQSPKQTMLLTPLGEACSRLDLTAIHQILEKVGYKDDEGIANEVGIYCIYCLIFDASLFCPVLNNVFSVSELSDRVICALTASVSTE